MQELVGRESLIDFFKHLIDRGRGGGKYEKEEDQRRIATVKQTGETKEERERREVFPFSSVSLFSGGLRRTPQWYIPYLCCHGNSLDSREKGDGRDGKRGREAGGEDRREKLVLRGRVVPLFQISVRPPGIRGARRGCRRWWVVANREHSQTRTEVWSNSDLEMKGCEHRKERSLA